jgi:hypothetical protein
MPEASWRAAQLSALRGHGKPKEEQEDAVGAESHISPPKLRVNISRLTERLPSRFDCHSVGRIAEALDVDVCDLISTPQQRYGVKVPPAETGKLGGTAELSL